MGLEFLDDTQIVHDSSSYRSRGRDDDQSSSITQARGLSFFSSEDDNSSCRAAGSGGGSRDPDRNYSTMSSVNGSVDGVVVQDGCDWRKNGE